MSFIERYKTAHTPEGVTLENAWESSKPEAPHPLMEGTPDDLKDLQKLCRSLARINNKDGEFHIGGGQVADLFNYKGNDETKWKRGRRAIAALEGFRVIKRIEVGHSGKNNTYQYLLDDLAETGGVLK